MPTLTMTITEMMAVSLIIQNSTASLTMAVILHHVKQATFVKLKKVLMTSFTQQQLMAFYSVAKNIRQDKVNQGVLASIKKEQGDPKRAVERSEWQPGTTKITQRLPGLDRHVKIKGWSKNVSKQLMVDRILRDAWNLVLLEEIEAPGELELFLKPWQIALLNVGGMHTCSVPKTSVLTLL